MLGDLIFYFLPFFFSFLPFLQCPLPYFLMHRSLVYPPQGSRKRDMSSQELPISFSSFCLKFNWRIKINSSHDVALKWSQLCQSNSYMGFQIHVRRLFFCYLCSVLKECTQICFLLKNRGKYRKKVTVSESEILFSHICTSVLDEQGFKCSKT